MRLFQVLAVGSLTAACAGFAAADGVRVPVGDVTQHDGAVAFDQRLAETASRFCFARYRPLELSAIAACKKAVREEAVDQLMPAQRVAFEQALHEPPTLASAGR